VDVKRAADLCAEGRTLRQIGAELGVTVTTVSHQLRRAGVTMRRGGASAHPASTQQILELRDQGLTWNEIAEQVDMTVQLRGAATAGPGPRSPHVLADGNRCSPTHLIKTLQLVYVQPSLIISAAPPRELNSLRHGEPPTVWSP